MSAHTPGPWMELDGTVYGNPGRAAVRGLSKPVADIVPQDAATAANTALVCAAPDLLAVLRLAVDGCSRDDEVWLDRDWVHRALDVIAKAEHGAVRP